MQRSNGLHNSPAIPAATLLAEVDANSVKRTGTVDSRLNCQPSLLNTPKEKPLTHYNVSNKSPDVLTKNTLIPIDAKFQGLNRSQELVPPTSIVVGSEPSLPAAKQAIFYQVLTAIMSFHDSHPGQLAIFGSCGIDLLHTHVDENVNDIDVLLNDEESANNLIIHLNQILQRIVFDDAFPWKDCTPNIRRVGNRPGTIGSSLLSGQTTLFHSGKPWIKIECTVKASWMKDLDFNHEHYVKKIPVYLKSEYSGTLPVLSTNGYLTLDLLALKKNMKGISAHTDNNYKLTMVLNSAVTLSKIEKHFITLYTRQQNQFFYDPEQLNELNALFQETIALIRNSHSVDLLYHCFFGSPYQLKDSSSDEKKKLINILSSREFSPKTAYAFKDLMILLRNDFNLEDTIKDGNCFYEALTSSLNKNNTATTNFLKTYNFLHNTSHQNTPDKQFAISSKMMRSTIHNWIACAHSAGLSPAEYEELNTLTLPESGKTVTDLLKNRTIADIADNPNDTAHYGWSSLLHILGIITGAIVILLKVNSKAQNIEKHKHGSHEANQLTPNLIKALRVKRPALLNSGDGDAQLTNLLFIAHSGGDHYYAASPTAPLMNFFKPYIMAERYLLAPVLAKEPAFKQPQHHASQPQPHQPTITLEAPVCSPGHSNTSPDPAIQHTNGSGKEVPASRANKKQPPSQNTPAESANPAVTQEAEREARIKKKHQIVSMMISNPTVFHSLGDSKKKTLGDSLFTEVFGVIKNPGQIPLVTVDMEHLSDAALAALEAGKRLNHTESILTLSLYKTIHHYDTNDPLFLMETLRDLQTANLTGHPQALVVLSILSALTGSPEALNLGMQPPESSDNARPDYHLHFVIPSEYEGSYQISHAIISAQRVRHFIENTDASSSDQKQIDRYFPVNEESYGILTPTLLISDHPQLDPADINAMTETMLHCVYKGHISLHRGNTGDALIFFLKSAIAYILATDNQTAFNQYQEAAGLSAVYLSIHLIPHIDQQCNLQATAPFLHTCMPHIDLIRHRLETANLKSLLYAIKAQRATNTLWAHSWFTYAYTKTAALLERSLPESFEEFRSLLDHEVKFLFDHGNSVQELPSIPDRQKIHTPNTTTLAATNTNTNTNAYALGSKRLETNPVLLEKYKISEKLETKKQTKKAVTIVRNLKERVDSLSRECLQLYQDASPKKNPDGNDIYQQGIALFDQCIELATQDIPIIARELEKNSRDRGKNNFLEKTKMQEATLMYNALYGFAALTHIKEKCPFKQELVRRVIQFYNTLVTKDSIESIKNKPNQNIDKFIGHFVELLNPAQYDDCPEHIVKELVTILFSCKRLVPNCLTDKNIFSIESLIKQWITYCHNGINLLETLELIVTFDFTDWEFHTTFNPIIDTILLKIQYITAKQVDGIDAEEQIMLYQKVEKTLEKFNSDKLISFYQSIWQPQLERLQKFTTQELTIKNVEAERCWDILIRQEQESNARELKKLEAIINSKLSTITATSVQLEQNNNHPESSGESDNEEVTSIENNQPSASEQFHEHTDTFSNKAYDLLKMAWQHHKNGEDLAADSILLDLLNNPMGDSLLMVQIKSLQADILIERFFSVVKQGIQRSQVVFNYSVEYLRKMESNLNEQKKLVTLDKNVRISLQKQQIFHLSNKICELVTLFSGQQQTLQAAFALQKEIINTLQLFTIDSDHETQDLSAIKDDLDLIINQQARISLFVNNIKTAGENLIKILNYRRQLLALIREVTAKRSISEPSCLPPPKSTPSKNRGPNMKNKPDAIAEVTQSEKSIFEIRSEIEILVKTVESFKAHLLDPELRNFAQSLIIDAL